MLAGIAGTLGQLFGIPVDHDPAVTQLLAQPGVPGQGPGRPVHVELRIAAGRPVVLLGQVQQLLAVRVQGAAHLLEQSPPLAQGHRAQGRTAHIARVRHGLAQIQALGGGLGHRLLGRRVNQASRGLVTQLPGVVEVRGEADHRCSRTRKGGDRATVIKKQVRPGPVVPSADGASVARPSPPVPVPGKVTLLGVLTLAGGVSALVMGILTAFGSLFMWCPWVYSIAVGVLGIVKGMALLGRQAETESAPRMVAMLQISNVLNCDFINLALGIFSLLLQADPEVRGWYGIADRGE